MKDDYEILETYTIGDDILTYLRHRKTGLEVVHHYKETDVTGFSFCVKTPVDDPWIGTSIVLQQCIHQESRKYDLSFSRLCDFSLILYCDFFVSAYNSFFCCYSLKKEEIFKMIPILADYVFFPRLSEEAFMQECVRVEDSPDGDGREKRLCGAVYADIKSMPPGESFIPGLYYKLNELTVEKIREYHKKYYRPDNSLFIFTGNSNLEDVLSEVDKFIPDLESAFPASEVSPRKNLTIDETLKQFPRKNPPEKLEEDDLTYWYMDSDDSYCRRFSEYWTYNFSPFTTFILEEEFAYTINSAIKDYPREPIPPEKSDQEIISEYLSRFTPEEYKIKLENLRKWQDRNVMEKAREIMEPLALLEDDEDWNTKESLEIKKRYHDMMDTLYEFPDIEIKTKENNMRIYFRCFDPLSREYYAELALFFYLQQFFKYRFEQKGIDYQVRCFCTKELRYLMSIDSTDKSQKIFDTIQTLFKEASDYEFTETDIIAIKFIFSKMILSEEDNCKYCCNKVFDVTPQELHEAAVKFSNMIDFYPTQRKWEESGNMVSFTDPDD